MSENEVNKKVSKRRIALIISIPILLVAIVALVLVVNRTFSKKSKADNSRVINENYALTKRDTSYTFNGGQMEITRNRIEENDADYPDTWTVLVYLVGSDLEGKYKAGTRLLREMASAGVNPNNIDKLNLIVQTGGAKKWNSDCGSTDKLYRLKLASDGIYDKIETLPIDNMGDPDVLADFIEWGFTKYPAKNTMVYFEDHGGTDNDMCYDELYNDDALTVHELEYAFATAKASLKAPIDIVLAHTCSNAVVEFANALAPYADYLIAAPSFIPTFGLNNKKFINGFLTANNKPATVKSIVNLYLDEFYNLCASDYNAYAKHVYSAIDLRKLDDFIVEFNNVAKQIFDASTVDRKTAIKINKAFRNTTRYQNGTNIDIGDYLVNIRQMVGINTSKCYKLLDKCVYKWVKGGAYNNNVLGLAIYHPCRVLTLQQLNIIRNKCISPYYFMYLERASHLMANKNFDNYKDYDWVNSKFFHEDTFNYLNYTYQRGNNTPYANNTYGLLLTNGEYASDGFVESWKENITEMPLGERKVFTSAKMEVTKSSIDATITENLEDIYTVYNTVFTKIGDETVCLGERANAELDEETGKVKTNFNGEWFMLGDGQLLTTYFEKVDMDYGQDGNNETKIGIQYTIPVDVDGKECTLYITESKDGIINQYINYGKADGINSGIEEPLSAGMKFTPIYDVWDEEKQTYVTEYGEEYTCTGNNDILCTTLKDDEYSYALIIDDASGYQYISKEVPFSVQNGEIKVEN